MIFPQVPEIVHYRESALDMSIIVFILCVNVAEFLCHIFIFRARLVTHTFHYCTGLDCNAVWRFGELCSCCCLPLLLQLVSSILADWAL